MESARTAGRFEGFVAGDDSGHLFQPVWWHPAWVPFASHIAGTLLCFDLAPGPGGIRGQILRLELQDEGPSIDSEDEGGPLQGTPFAAWLDRYLADLRGGKYAQDPAGNLSWAPDVEA